MPASLRKRLVAVASTSALALAVAAVPFSIDPIQGDAGLVVAHAKGGGGGGSGGGGAGGGNGGGNAGGNAGGSAASNAGGHGGQGQGQGQGQGHADQGRGGQHGQGHAGPGHSGTDRGRGGIASQLGNLNAAHASPTALSHAAPNSTVGMLATYRDGVEDGTITSMSQAQAELGQISNKGVNSEVVSAVNDLLGVSLGSDSQSQ